MLIPIFLPECNQDIDEILNYFEELSEDTADHFHNAVTETVWMLLETPEIGELFRLDFSRKTRFRTVTGFPNYVIFYRVENGTLEIIRILHGSRDYTDIFGK